ncbi:MULTISPECIES: hypothetical protein [unclassified Pseudomonas]|uniref:hypothetical protein n=1 Tax=unclassified Pseudomonas TaxID=196821 RepID=UPI000BDD332C|nr:MULTISPECIES: hypothetical protein [unclassified Pseudomonas]PVZ16504.1 hypothetical protein F474_02024 [Pseudomonas sp. URIL14HWK12:I12]PVZ25640.1 hypothetical protein F470_01086 [Pseudomonas sp. URIL14HWK12:I10]PVZ36836.1 hypothetical protein F472_02024 [Pseudomonas sp. URIL14HWK12:I11]SNZ12516.1 hypothetical protein SAMN05660463_02063 [Pseudomonas sp. URIL14HWK12:I9]
MDVILEEPELSGADLRGALELWVTSPGGPHAPIDGAGQFCLWRGRPVVSHDMLSEGTHEQNVRRLWVRLAQPGDKGAIERAEQQVRERVAAQGLEGEFYPTDSR